MPDLTPEYLAELEAKAKAAEWEADGPARSFTCDCGIGEATHAYIAAANPAVTLALIARIRELEERNRNQEESIILLGVSLHTEEDRTKAAEVRIRAADRLAEAGERLKLNRYEGAIGQIETYFDAALAAYQEAMK